MNGIKEIWNTLTELFSLAFYTLEKLLDGGEYKKLVFIMLGLVVAWHIYTPVHELLHVAGCRLVGGTVEELALKPQYGATVLQHIFPFIVAESDYAGQLTGFTTPNHWGYAVVDFFPYILSLFGGLLITWCYKKESTFLFGLAVILAFVPLMSLPGDFFEAASLATSHWLGNLRPELGSTFLLSDDAFLLFGQIWEAGQFSLLVSSFFILTVILALLMITVLMIFQVFIVRWIYGSQFIPALSAKPISQENRDG